MVSYLDCGLELSLLAIFQVGWVGRGVAGLVGLDLLLLLLLFLLMVCDGLGEGERVLRSACVVRLKLRYVVWSGVCVLVYI